MTNPLVIKSNHIIWNNHSTVQLHNVYSDLQCMVANKCDSYLPSLLFVIRWTLLRLTVWKKFIWIFCQHLLKLSEKVLHQQSHKSNFGINPCLKKIVQLIAKNTKQLINSHTFKITNYFEFLPFVLTIEWIENKNKSLLSPAY